MSNNRITRQLIKKHRFRLRCEAQRVKQQTSNNSTPGAPTAADFDALVAKFNALLARVRPTTGIALIAA